MDGTTFVKKLEADEICSLKSYALKSTERRRQLGAKFRSHTQKEPLEYRTEYHRDRDRIVWSRSFKRLQSKTQVFPHYAEDHYRRRLTHSLEVAQIATTIARALGLNEVATEAIAFGHDLGHTPFGHSGERAMHKILQERKKEFIKKSKRGTSSDFAKLPIFYFNHCVHGIEVVARIEKDYRDKAGGHVGLNLTYDVEDGILKHMYVPGGRDSAFPRMADVTKFTTYSKFGDNKGSLEAQSVYFADKIAYLLGDIEDGIRSQAFKPEKIAETAFYTALCNEFSRRRKIKYEKLISSIDDFQHFRRMALATLILNCITNAELQIRELRIKSVNDVLSAKRRIVYVSENIKSEWDHFYQEWMAKKLFTNPQVVACEYKANNIITMLFNAYMERENLIGNDFREYCESVYEDIGIHDKQFLKILTVKNYIAGMTDPYATEQHKRLFMSTERAGFI
jgi:dGTPase